MEGSPGINASICTNTFNFQFHILDFNAFGSVTYHKKFRLFDMHTNWDWDRANVRIYGNRCGSRSFVSFSTPLFLSCFSLHVSLSHFSSILSVGRRLFRLSHPFTVIFPFFFFHSISFFSCSFSVGFHDFMLESY